MESPHPLEATPPSIISSHDRILNAAKELFARLGYEATSTAAIARLAGSSQSQLIKHFGSKEGLLDAVFDEGWKTLKGGFSSVSELRCPKRRLYALLDLMMSALSDDDDLKDIMLQEGRRMHHGHTPTAMASSSLHLIQMIDSILGELKSAGELKPEVHVQALRSAILGMLSGLLRAQMLARRIDYPAKYTQEEVKQTIEMALSGFLVNGK
jgi:AcrR family transcriptional regulator